MEKLLLPAVLLLSLLYLFYQRWAYRDKDDKGSRLTGPATVKAHRVEQGRFHGKAPGRWNHIVTFALSDGEEIDIYVGEGEYQELKDGTSGQLTWQGKTFLEFETDD